MAKQGSREALMTHLAAGMALTEAIEAAGIRAKNAQQWIRNEGFQQELLKRTRDRLALTAPKALATLIAQMDGADGRVAQSAAKELLERTGIVINEQNSDLVVRFEGVSAPGMPEEGGKNHGKGMRNGVCAHADAAAVPPEQGP